MRLFCSHREGLGTENQFKLVSRAHLVVVDETADQWPGKAMSANLYTSFTKAQSGNHLYDELAFLKRAGISCSTLSIYFLKDHYFEGRIKSNSFQF